MSGFFGIVNLDDGSVDFGQQPLSFDGDVWLLADARIDGDEGRAPDAERIVSGYEKWGEGCVDHLIGDFAFAIWDTRRQRLFCARDHFGVKPFYYARVGNSFIFSNT